LTATLALRHVKTSLWELTNDNRIALAFEKHRGKMLPDNVIRR